MTPTEAEALFADLLAAWARYNDVTATAEAMVDAAEAKVREAQSRFGDYVAMEEDDGTVHMVFAGTPLYDFANPDWMQAGREILCGAPTKRGTPCQNVIMWDGPDWPHHIERGPFAHHPVPWVREKYDAAAAVGFRCHLHRRPHLTVVGGMSA